MDILIMHGAGGQAPLAEAVAEALLPFNGTLVPRPSEDSLEFLKQWAHTRKVRNETKNRLVLTPAKESSAERPLQRAAATARLVHVAQLLNSTRDDGQPVGPRNRHAPFTWSQQLKAELGLVEREPLSPNRSLILDEQEKRLLHGLVEIARLRAAQRSRR